MQNYFSGNAETEPIDDPRYGDLSIKHYRWGFDDYLVTGDSIL